MYKHLKEKLQNADLHVQNKNPKTIVGSTPTTQAHLQLMVRSKVSYNPCKLHTKNKNWKIIMWTSTTKKHSTSISG